ncbi:MAG TPA: FAD-linked oxidase C-terminal domain-containing protein [Thermoanaerobaculia bacterium]|nr:FAD-linked oxidase C-terminal domain-containing protein [Thermoanaerobaculia bacterium]
MATFQRLGPDHLRQLRALLGDQAVLTAADRLEAYARDETETLRFPPEVVVLPRTAEQVAALLAYADRELLPVTPRGGGTGLSGGALPVRGGIALSLERLDRIRAIDGRDMVVEAEAGVVTGRLQEAVEAEGLFYPPDPSSRDSCQLGGNLAEDAAGPRSLLYGTTRQYVLGLEVALADGTLLRTGGRNRKDAAGYNLTQLLVGSEGTLGVMTAAVLRLLPLPGATLSLMLPFRQLDEAAAAVEGVCRASRTLAACELVERNAVRAVAAVMPVPDWLQEQEAVLLLELHGERGEELLEEAARLAELAESLGAGEVQAAEDAAEQRRLWAIRRQVGDAVMRRSPYKEADTVVPRSRLAELVRAARRVATSHGLEAISYGHAGDGNLHVNLLQSGLPEGEWQVRRDAAEAELFRAVLELGGSITGEHGIGWTQRRHFAAAVSPRSLQLMRELKKAFDPRGILNPDKIFLEGDE